MMPRFPLDDVLKGIRSLGDQLRKAPETAVAGDWLADRVDQIRERQEQGKTLEELQVELDALVGLDTVKEQVRAALAWVIEGDAAWKTAP